MSFSELATNNSHKCKSFISEGCSTHASNHSRHKGYVYNRRNASHLALMPFCSCTTNHYSLLSLPFSHHAAFFGTVYTTTAVNSSAQSTTNMAVGHHTCTVHSPVYMRPRSTHCQAAFSHVHGFHADLQMRPSTARSHVCCRSISCTHRKVGR
jgi:hypothetical protein